MYIDLTCYVAMHVLRCPISFLKRLLLIIKGEILSLPDLTVDLKWLNPTIEYLYPYYINIYYQS